MTRQEMIDQVRILEDRYHTTQSRETYREMQALCRQLNRCICRNCGKEYDNQKARGDYRGFCSAKCQHEKARELGYRPSKGHREYGVLKSANMIGDDTVIK
jgi:hypothetical protein